MLEQLLDRLHCYPLAVPIRGLKKAVTSRTPMQQEWIQKYNWEEWIGVAILQAKFSIEEEKRTLLLKETTEMREDRKGVAGDRDITTKLENYETKLVHFRKDFWLHQQALQKLVHIKPEGPWIREWELMRQRTRNNMTLAWIEGSKACVLKGGCCGRPCGCCEKPLRTYLGPSDGMSNGEKKIKHFYGHCTVECRCCVQSRGFSKPDPEFIERVNKHYGR